MQDPLQVINQQKGNPFFIVDRSKTPKTSIKRKNYECTSLSVSSLRFKSAKKSIIQILYGLFTLLKRPTTFTFSWKSVREGTSLLLKQESWRFHQNERVCSWKRSSQDSQRYRWCCLSVVWLEYHTSGHQDSKYTFAEWWKG